MVKKMKEVMDKTKLNRLKCIKPLFDEFSEEEKSKEQI